MLPRFAPVVRCTECNVPFVLRYTVTLDARPPRFLYQRDCKHRDAPFPKGSSLDELETAVLDVFTRRPS